MIFEQATLQVAPEKAKEFEAVIAGSTPLFRTSSDCHSLSLEKVIEHPGRYVLRIGWSSVEAHTVDFVSTEAFSQFRERVTPFLTAAPDVIHVEPTSHF